MKKTSIAIAIAVSFGVAGAAHAQFDVTLGDGPGVVAGQVIESSVVANASSFVHTQTITPGTSIDGAATFGATETGGVLGLGGSSIAGGGPNELSSLGDTGSYQQGLSEFVTAGADSTAAFSGTAGTNNGTSGASFSADGVTLFDITTIDLIAVVTGDTYATLNGSTLANGTVGGAFGGGPNPGVALADVDLLQTAISTVDLEGFDLSEGLVGSILGPL